MRRGRALLPLGSDRQQAERGHTAGEEAGNIAVEAGAARLLLTHSHPLPGVPERTAQAELRLLGDPLSSHDDPIFLAIFYRDLRALIAADPHTAVRSSIERFADEAWLKSRDPTTGLFAFGAREPTLLEQAAMVQIYAQLAVS